MVVTRSKRKEPSTGLKCDETCTFDECSICLSELNPQSQVSLACGHLFHAECIVKHLQMDRRCPLCRHRPQTETEDDGPIIEELDTGEEVDEHQQYTEDVVSTRVAKRLSQRTMKRICRDCNIPDELIDSWNIADMIQVVTEQLCYETATDEED